MFTGRPLTRSAVEELNCANLIHFKEKIETNISLAEKAIAAKRYSYALQKYNLAIQSGQFYLAKAISHSNKKDSDWQGVYADLQYTAARAISEKKRFILREVLPLKDYAAEEKIFEKQYKLWDTAMSESEKIYRALNRKSYAKETAKLHHNIERLKPKILELFAQKKQELRALVVDKNPKPSPKFQMKKILLRKKLMNQFQNFRKKSLLTRALQNSIKFHANHKNSKIKFLDLTLKFHQEQEKSAALLQSNFALTRTIEQANQQIFEIQQNRMSSSAIIIQLEKKLSASELAKADLTKQLAVVKIAKATLEDAIKVKTLESRLSQVEEKADSTSSPLGWSIDNYLYAPLDVEALDARGSVEVERFLAQSRLVL